VKGWIRRDMRGGGLQRGDYSTRVLGESSLGFVQELIFVVRKD
jgi:hypothetical protein